MKPLGALQDTATDLVETGLPRAAVPESEIGEGGVWERRLGGVTLLPLGCRSELSGVDEVLAERRGRT